MVFPYYFDPTFIILIPAVLFSLWAQFKVQSSYNTYSKMKVSGVASAAELSRTLLAAAGLSAVAVEQVAGELTDHYDPRKKVLRLSKEIFNSNSVAALGIAAHEVGHALQHQKAYMPLEFRNNFFPVANIGTTAALPLFIVGLFFASPFLMNMGILFFAAAVLFHIITLPVEFDASGRAIKLLEDGKYLQGEGLKGAKAVLSSAALTYIAATAMAVLQLIRLLILKNNRE